MSGIFKAYDIRGVVPDELDAELVFQIGRAFARALEPGRVVLGRDMRVSSEELADALASGLAAESVDVIELGLCSTDMLYFASGMLDAHGAMVTASHNPGSYNGIKFCGPGAAPIGVETGLVEVERVVRAGLFPLDPKRPKGQRRHEDLLEAYVRHVRSFVDPAKFAGLKVVADTANGMGGLVVPAVFDELGAELEVLYPELDGTFPNHPADPIQPENLIDLKARVLSSGADLGLAFDGDADRVFLVDDRAAPISGSTTTAIIARRMLEREPGATILYNLICSRAVPEIVREHGGVPVRTRVGHSFIKAEMARTGAIFAGEHSGHYYFRDNYRADSGVIGAVTVLEELAEAGIELSTLRKEYERYAASGEINSRVHDAAAVIAFVEQAFQGEGRADHLDGLTLEFDDWWFNLRPSNTEPLLRLNLEARTPDDVARRTQQVLAVIAKAESMEG
jgi:phosphomannomutase